MRKTLLAIGIAAVSALPCSALIQETVPSTVPATTEPADAEELQVTITAVQGIVQVRGSEQEQWKKAEVGMVLGQNAEFRTALRSAVQFTIPPDQVVTLDRLGTVKVLQAIMEKGVKPKLKTKLGMEYGRTRYDIEASGVEHESTISSPSSTLAVRGTKVSVYDQRPFASQAVSLTGRAEFRDFRKRVFLGGKNAGKHKIDTNSTSTAAFALNDTVVDPTSPLARSGNETPLINNLISSGATIDYDYEKQIRVVRGGSVPGDAQLIPALPGVLNFVMRWTGAHTDLNLGVIAPGVSGNRTVYPIGGYDRIASGGKTDFDHRGGSRGGIEVVYFNKTFPEGIYRIGAFHVTGANSPGTVDVFLNGKRVGILTSQGTVNTANFIGEPIDPEIASGVSVGIVRLPAANEAKSAKSASVSKSKKR